MSTDNNTHNNSGAGWQILGELELPVGASVEDTLNSWLTKILQPLHFQPELLNKIIVSAQDAVARSVHAEIMDKFVHIHLVVFVLSERDAKEKAWGFFHLEKIEDPKDEQAGGDHAVEFYLYGEGD